MSHSIISGSNLFRCFVQKRPENWKSWKNSRFCQKKTPQLKKWKNWKNKNIQPSFTTISNTVCRVFYQISLRLEWCFFLTVKIGQIWPKLAKIKYRATILKKLKLDFAFLVSIPFKVPKWGSKKPTLVFIEDTSKT